MLPEDSRFSSVGKTMMWIDIVCATSRSSHSEVLCKKVFYKKPEACNFIKKEAMVQLFFCEFCKIFKSSFYYRTPPVDASVLRLESRWQPKYLIVRYCIMSWFPWDINALQSFSLKKECTFFYLLQNEIYSLLSTNHLQSLRILHLNYLEFRGRFWLDKK